ncbi:MAG TPA: IS66 family transposase [Ignavibacteria bacterium]|nr:IS66 family transposase [Ignavibacteria bacterium]
MRFNFFKNKSKEKSESANTSDITRSALKKKSKGELIDIILSLAEQLKSLEDKISKLSKNSSNSSKPPSSDITNPKGNKNSSGRKRTRGAQKGHQGTMRNPFTKEEVDKVENLAVMSECPDCHDFVFENPDNKPKIQQVAELVENPIYITEYIRSAFWCARCDKIHYAPLPEGVIENQLFGARLQALVGYMKGTLHCSYSGIQEILKDVFKISVCRGLLCNTIRRINEAIETPYNQLHEHIKTAKTLFIDESGWKDNGARYWAWVFATKLVSFFTIEKSRGSIVLKEILGDIFKGAIVSDFFSAYIKYANAAQQFCLAHLIRDIKFLITLNNPLEQWFGKKLIVQFRLLFHLWHLKEKVPKKKYKNYMNRITNKIENILSNSTMPPHTAKLAKRFNKRWDSIFRFIFNNDLEPTNNIAERAIRALVLDRKVTQGSRSLMGRQWNARIWTVLSSCKKQNRSSWQFIVDSIRAFHFDQPYPSLIPVAI